VARVNYMCVTRFIHLCAMTVCVGVCVRACVCVRAYVRACMCVCVRERESACVRVWVYFYKCEMTHVYV